MEITRKEFLAGAAASVGALGATAAGTHFWLPRKDSLRVVKHGFTAKDYVQDGLLAMWDVDSAFSGSAMVDQSPNGWDLTGNFTVEDGSITGSGITNNSFDFTKIKHVEFVLNIDNTREQVLLSGGGNETALAYYSGSIRRGSGYASSFPVTIGEWIAGSFDYDALKSWKNGVFQNGKLTDSLNNTSDKLYVFRFANDSAGNFAFRGKWKTMRIYSQSLTDERREKNYAVDKARFNIG